MNNKVKFNKTSEKTINAIFEDINNFDIIEDKESFKARYYKTVLKDLKMLKDCSERSIVNFYKDTVYELLKSVNKIDEDFWKRLTAKTRVKLAKKYTSSKTFDNNIDIYFNDVKKEYILHPQEESNDLEFNEENRDIFIKNNLKLCVECAKRYQNLGLPLEDLIQIGNIGLLTAFEKFDTDRANLRFSILKSIRESNNEVFTPEEAEELIRKNFKYSKSLELTLSKLPEEGFVSKEEFEEWTNDNIKKASFASISFMWIRAAIIVELSKFSKIIRVPKSAKNNDAGKVSIIRLDSINPHTDDNYSDNATSDVTMNEFIANDENIENMEKQNMFKSLVDNALDKLNNVDRRIIMKRFGIDTPYQLSINEIAENEGLAPNKVKYSILNSLKLISSTIPEKDKEMIREMFK